MMKQNSMDINSTAAAGDFLLVLEDNYEIAKTIDKDSEDFIHKEILLETYRDLIMIFKKGSWRSQPIERESKDSGEDDCMKLSEAVLAKDWDKEDDARWEKLSQPSDTVEAGKCDYPDCGCSTGAYFDESKCLREAGRTAAANIAYKNLLRDFADHILEWRTASFAEQIQKYGGMAREDAIKKFMATYPAFQLSEAAAKGDEWDALRLKLHQTEQQLMDAEDYIKTLKGQEAKAIAEKAIDKMSGVLRHHIENLAFRHKQLIWDDWNKTADEYLSQFESQPTDTVEGIKQ